MFFRRQPSINTLALIRLLEYAPWNVECGREVVRTLVAQGPRAVPVLVEALDDAHRSPVARGALAWVLGEIGGASAESALARACEDPEPAVASIAQQRMAALVAA